ncbi:hypothetical protein INT44_004352 [Umbelopsis vinacea]|uniref:6-phosphofructo-2-kinase domain-containing protein n=1 Tax=Umbelopsis vinacea TaxID=44442 RepID=A0A8H7QC94_9FUNG|nr:hypothetical protein INT44_004352 [Umbelopsis vinacea]
MRWLGVTTKVFSVGNYRRDRLGSMPNSWFDPNNKSAKADRIKIANDCLEDLIKWITVDGGQVAVYDANSESVERRQYIFDRLNEEQIHPVFIESICNKPEVIQANIRSVKISSPDVTLPLQYIGWDPEQAVKDFEQRIEQHMATYETMTDLSQPFVKLMNVGEQIIVNNVHGYLQSRLVFYLMNLHIQPRTIYFARPGPSMNDMRYKEDPDLAPEGHEYAEALKDFLLSYRARQRQINAKEEDKRPLNNLAFKVWTSARKRSKQTALHFAEDGIIIRQQTTLTQINPGECDGLTPEEIKEKFPDEIVKAQKDPYTHRFPRAESYHDLAVRLESVIMELEREKNDVLIIAHDSVLRCLYAYLFDRTEEEIPRIPIPRNTLIEVTPTAYGAKESRMQFIETDHSPHYEFEH